jgi:hypothetical protein
MYIEKNKIDWPVTVEECKTHLRRGIDFTTDDDYISRLIKTATHIIEQMVQFDIAYTENIIEIDDFIGSTVSISEGNFRSVLSIKNSNDVSIGYDNIILPKLRIPHKFKIVLSESIDSDPLEVRFYTGWQREDVLETFSQAILMKVSDLYTVERGSYGFSNYKYNEAIERLVRPYRMSYV